MTAWAQIEQIEEKLDKLFMPGCDPYAAAAVVLLDKAEEAVTQDDRDLVKRVCMRVAARRTEGARTSIEQALRRSADMLHEIGSAIAAEDLVAGCRNEILAEKLRENLRSRDQIKKISADGFELCVRALAEMGASDVSIHECRATDLEPW